MATNIPPAAYGYQHLTAAAQNVTWSGTVTGIGQAGWTNAVYTYPAQTGSGQWVTSNLPQGGYILANTPSQNNPYIYDLVDALKPAYLSREDFTEEEITKAEQIMEELSD